MLNVGRSAVLSQWRDDGEDNSMTLSRVPNWVGAESANPSVILPSCNVEPIRIVFDKSADTWSKVSSREPSAFPLMIDREMSSFLIKPSPFVQISYPRTSPIKGLSQQKIEYTGGASNNEDHQSLEEEQQIPEVDLLFPRLPEHKPPTNRGIFMRAKRNLSLRW